jgi:hypothetical protein
VSLLSSKPVLGATTGAVLESGSNMTEKMKERFRNSYQLKQGE